MKNLINTVTVVTLLMASGSAVASEEKQGQKRCGPPSFSSIDLNGSGLLIAKNPADFAKKITQLVYDYPARVRLAINSLNHIKTHFNKAVCFHDLSTYLDIK